MTADVRRNSMSLARSGKRREQFENAKKMKKYRKLLKRLPYQEQTINIEEPRDTEWKKSHGAASTDDAFQLRIPSEFNKKGRQVPTKRMNTLEALRKHHAKKREEEYRLKAERMEALKSKEEKRLKALKSRKDMKSKMFKRTKSGQPLMKHRLQHILESIQQRQ